MKFKRFCFDPYLQAATTIRATRCQLTTIPQLRAMSSSSAMSSSGKATLSPLITKLTPTDYAEWSRLFRAYIDFYQSSLPEAQYRATFERLIDAKKDLYALVLRDESDELKLRGLAHFYPHQTPWSEKLIMHLNDLYIDPSLRGNGMGKEMILAVVEAAQEAGCLRVEWATRHENPARKLYDQLATCEFVEYRVKF